MINVQAFWFCDIYKAFLGKGKRKEHLHEIISRQYYDQLTNPFLSFGYANSDFFLGV